MRDEPIETSLLDVADPGVRAVSTDERERRGITPSVEVAGVVVVRAVLAQGVDAALRTPEIAHAVVHRSGTIGRPVGERAVGRGHGRIRFEESGRGVGESPGHVLPRVLASNWPAVGSEVGVECVERALQHVVVGRVVRREGRHDARGLVGLVVVALVRF